MAQEPGWSDSSLCGRGKLPFPASARKSALKGPAPLIDRRPGSFLRDLISVDVPVYIFAGERNRITDLAQTQRWFYALKAPHKRLEVVESAGHLNLFEAPERFSGSCRLPRMN